MPSTHIVRESAVNRSPRVKQIEGMFELSAATISHESWSVDLPIDTLDWSIGVIVGPSGSGKTTVARELFGDHIISGYDWSESESIVDGFPKSMSIKDVTQVLSSVGFSSPPAWLRPFHVLSNGEQFRVTMARALAENDGTCVVDEFTSVVDRTVAKIGSAAIAKAVRRSGKRFIAVTCHYDVLEWLEPDWIYEPHTARFSRDRLQRPKIELRVEQVRRDAWEIFRRHHYLSHTLNQSAKCYMATIEGQPAAFCAVLAQPNVRPLWRLHRTVCLPDFQGVGIGNVFNEFICGMYSCSKSVTSTTSHPAMIHYRAKSKRWKMTRAPGQSAPFRSSKDMKKTASLRKNQSSSRNTASFEYVGPKNCDDAQKFGLI